jgi:CHAT domain-containing protein
MWSAYFIKRSSNPSLLGPDEALVGYLSGIKKTFAFVLRQDRVEAKVIKLGAGDLDGDVGILRRGLDLTGLNRLPSFDTTEAFALYQKIFEPVEPLLKGARHVFVVPDGALTGLPLGVLVTDRTEVDDKDPASCRKVLWLAKKYAMSTLPSVSSLRALRTFAKRTQASRPFLGIGDPELEGESGVTRGIKLVSLFTPPGVADVKAVRQLAPLPESRKELLSLARSLGAGEGSLLVGRDATETKVKAAPLSDFKVLAFATHGLVAGELTGLSKPALVLTPPEKATEMDDGLLTASEVAQLKLNADWVILSACNTAAADGTPGAQGLSGLAKAFFYAGSRALLVSHWPVASDAAVALTTRMLALSRQGINRAEAHRQAMMALIDTGPSQNAHPAMWAPFVVVGEGGR